MALFCRRICWDARSLSSKSIRARPNRCTDCACTDLLLPRLSVLLPLSLADADTPGPLTRVEDVMHELTITVEVSKGRHPNVVHFLGATFQPRDFSIALVFELCDPYDLYHLLHHHKLKLTMLQKLQLARESAAGLAFLHEKNILHYDFGSRNLLIKVRLTALFALLHASVIYF